MARGVVLLVTCLGFGVVALAGGASVDVEDQLHDSVQLSTAEAERRHRQEFDTVDINKDGELWYVELEAVSDGFGTTGYEVWDSNDDRVVTFDEYRLNDLIWQTIRQHDGDGDSKLTRAEIGALTLPGFSGWCDAQAIAYEGAGGAGDKMDLENVLAPVLRLYLPVLAELMRAQHKLPLEARDPLVRALFQDTGADTLTLAQTIATAGKLALERVEPTKGTAQYEERGNQENFKREGVTAKYAHFSRVTEPRPNTIKYRQFYQARPYKVILKPGDFLFIPRGWWHWIRSYGRSYAVNFWFNMTNVTHAEAVPASRSPPAWLAAAGAGGASGGVAMGADDQPWQGLRSEEEVPIFQPSQLSRAHYEHHVSRARPFIVPGGAAAWPAVSLWNDSYISAAIKARKPANDSQDMLMWLTKSQVDEVTGVGQKNDFVLPKSTDYFFDDATRAAGGGGGKAAAVSEGGAAQHQQQQQQQQQQDPREKFAAEQEAFFNGTLKLSESAGGSSKYLMTLAHFTQGKNAHIIDALRPDIETPAFIGEQELAETNFWINPPQRGHDTGLHYDDQDGVLAQLHGVKSITLYSPWESEGVYPRVATPVIKGETACDCAAAPEGDEEEGDGGGDAGSGAESGAESGCSKLAMLIKCADFVHDTGVYVSGQLFKPVAFAAQLKKPLRALLPSSVLLWWSLQAAGAPHAMYHYIKALQDHVGKNEMVWSFKKVGEKFSWEIYFYGWPQVSAEMPSADSYTQTPRKNIGEITEINKRFFKGQKFVDTKLPPKPDGTTMIIFSFDMHPDFFTGNAPAEGAAPEQAKDAPMYRDGVHIYTVPAGTELKNAVIGHGNSMSLGDDAKQQGPHWKPEVEWCIFMPR